MGVSRCVAPAPRRQTGAAQDTPPAAHCFDVRGPAGKLSHVVLLPVSCSDHAPHAALLNPAFRFYPHPLCLLAAAFFSAGMQLLARYGAQPNSHWS